MVDHKDMRKNERERPGARSTNRWNYSSEYHLQEAEQALLSTTLKQQQQHPGQRHKYNYNSYDTRLVEVDHPTIRDSDKPCNVWTLIFNKHATNTPIVLIHGYGSGVGWWCMNYEKLSENRPVYALDLIGFGQSSRPHFSSDPLQIEEQWVNSIESWRQKVLNTDKFILLGHSLGGFIATSYAMRHHDKIKHLILVDPWGFSEDRPSTTMSLIGRLLNPLSFFRWAGPLGLPLLRNMRSDITRKFSTPLALEYLYHCMAAKKPTGEVAFKNLMVGYAWAKRPMMTRMRTIFLWPTSKYQLPMTFIYGQNSWIDKRPGFLIKGMAKKSQVNVNVKIVPGAGHQVNVDAVEKFNNLVNRIGECVDNGKYLPSNEQDNEHDYYNHQGINLRRMIRAVLNWV